MKRIFLMLLIIVLMLSGCIMDEDIFENQATTSTSISITGSTATSEPTTVPTNTLTPTRSEPTVAVETVIPTQIDTPTVEPTYTYNVTPSTLAQEWQQDILELKALFLAQELPEDFSNDEEETIIEDPTLFFDPNEIFTVLDHLSMQLGYDLAFVYLTSNLEGFPVVYAKKEGEIPYRSFSEFAQARPECAESRADSCYASNQMEHDGTDLGYLQFLTFELMYEQFYLYWHSNYNDGRPVATSEQLELILEWVDPDMFNMEYEAFTSYGEFGFTDEQKALARRIDLEPIVTIKEDGAEVRFVYYTKWGGFYELKAWVPRENLIDYGFTESTQLVEYEIPLNF
ncbi:MAG: hypothetical protein AAGU15_06870 [Anaerolineaceae bacterium]